MGGIFTFDSLSYIILATVLLLVSHRVLLWMFATSYKKLPPGPREWGTNWRLLKASWDGTLPVLAFEWAKKYGHLTFLYSLGRPILFLNTAEITRLMFGSDKYKLLVADRPEIYMSSVSKFNGKDLIFSKYDAPLKKKRRLFHNLLNLYGDGVERFENVVWEEMQKMFADIDSCRGQDAPFTNNLIWYLKNILYIMTLGKAPADPSDADILDDYDAALNRLSKADVDIVLYLLPFIAHIPSKFKRAKDHAKAAKKKADEHFYYEPKRRHVPGQPRGITDLLLESHKRPGYEWMGEDEEHTIAFLMSLFFAAQLTSRASLTGIFLCLLNSPEVTKKIQKEIDRVIGDERPKIEHKNSMPYTEATILEGLRLISQVPLSGFRTPAQDFEFEGFLIPKDTLIFMNMWHFNHNENVWKDPWTFKPERFLDNEGHLLPIDHPIRKEIVSFGAGVRSCPGEIFARSLVFLTVTSILQRYNMLAPKHGKLPPSDFQVYDESIQGLVRQTVVYKCRFIRRKQVQT